METVVRGGRDEMERINWYIRVQNTPIFEYIRVAKQCHWFKDPKIFLPRSCTLFLRVLQCVN